MRSPYVSCLDFFLCDHTSIKSFLYENSVISAENLVAHFSAAVGDVLNITDVLSSVRQSMHCRCKTCLTFFSLLVAAFLSTFCNFLIYIFFCLYLSLQFPVIHTVYVLAFYSGITIHTFLYKICLLKSSLTAFPFLTHSFKSPFLNV